MFKKTKAINVILTFSLLLPYLSFSLPKLSKVESTEFVTIVQNEQGGSVCDQAPDCHKIDNSDDESQKWESVSWNSGTGNIIRSVYIKSGRSEFRFSADDIWYDSPETQCYEVTGIGTSLATASRIGSGNTCQEISHVDFWFEADDSNSNGEPTDPLCVVGESVWAHEVINATNEGNPLQVNTDSSAVLGEADSNSNDGTFYSLGNSGSLTISFEFPIIDTLGNDIIIYEATRGSRASWPESAKVEVSPNGTLWSEVANITNAQEQSGVDISSSNFPWIKYVRLTDTTADTRINYDFDVNAVKGVYGTCEQGNMNWGTIEGTKCEDLDGDGKVYGEGTERCWLNNLGVNGIEMELVDFATGNIVSTQRTDSNESTGKNGYYKFENIDVSRRYILREVVPAGWYPTSPTSGQHNINWTNIYNNRGDFEVTRNFANSRITVSDVTLCKYDENRNSLPGWELMLISKEIIGEGDVYSRSENGSTNSVTSMNLDEGTYLIVANGTYRFANWPNGAGIADAGYSLRIPGQSYSYHENDYPTWVSGDKLNNTGYLEVNVGGNNVDWGTFNEEHKYYLMYNHTGGNLDFTILDTNYRDNSGFISIGIYKAYTGVTEEEGCVTFEGVDFGEYVVDETIENPSKWQNLSGLGDVEINQINHRFLVVNDYIEDPADLVIFKVDDNDDNIVEAGEEIVYTITYANVGEDMATNVIITEIVPLHTTYTGDEGWVCEVNPAVAGTKCTYLVGDLQGQNTDWEEARYQTITFTVTVNLDVKEGDKILNTAIISSDTEEANVENNSDDADEILVAGGNGEVEGENTVELRNERAEQYTPTATTDLITPSVLGVATEKPEVLATTGSEIAWLMAVLGLITIGTSGYVIIKKKRS